MMKLTKLLACALVLAAALCAVSCKKDAQTTNNTQDTPDTSVTTNSDGEVQTDKVTGEDVQFGEPTDSFELPAESKGIVGKWKLGGAEGAAIKGMEIWEFKDDGSFNMINTDTEGVQSGAIIPGQYRIKGSELTVTMMGMPIKYTFKLENGNIMLNDHGSDTLLEPFTGNITYQD